MPDLIPATKPQPEFDDLWLHRKLETVYRFASPEARKEVCDAIDIAFERVSMEKLEQYRRPRNRAGRGML